MSNAMKVVSGIGGFILLSVLAIGCGIMSTYNSCIRQENGLEAQYQQNQNNYANFFNSLKETAQVPAMYTADLEKVYKTAITGRYGDGGSKAVVSFIHEQNPTLDPNMYIKIQSIIEAGHNSFEADQKTLLDKRRVYQNTIGEAPGSMIAGAFGFPRVDLKKYDPVINDVTANAFATKKAGPINLTGGQ